MKAARLFSGLLITGPRRAGKTTLLQKLFPKAEYHLLEDPDVIDRVRSDPRSFLDGLKTPVILDEMQNVPELFNYVRTRMDAHPARKGRWLMTGSQEAPLMKGISESMAGRIGIFQLLPFSTHESKKVSFLKGGFPEVIAHPSARELYFRSYVQTYLERDVRSITAIRDLATFENPNQLSVGMQYVLVNGVPVIADGKMTDALPGQVLRGAGYQAATRRESP